MRLHRKPSRQMRAESNLAFFQRHLQECDASMAVRVRDTLFAAQAVTRGQFPMVDRGRDRVLANGHGFGQRRSACCASKHALEGMTKAMGIELVQQRYSLQHRLPHLRRDRTHARLQTSSTSTQKFSKSSIENENVYKSRPRGPIPWATAAVRLFGRGCLPRRRRSSRRESATTQTWVMPKRCCS